MDKLLTLEQAAARRDTGMERAVARADRAVEFWSEDAYAFVFEICSMLKSPKAKEHGLSSATTFLTEDVRAYAEKRGLTPPPDQRAWGAVMQRAAKHGLIRRIGYMPARSSNLSPKALWAAC